VNMDYPDEDVEEIVAEKLKDSLSAINDDILKLLARSREGRLLREGISIALVGRPNVGKSSLLNLFLREERSIVTEIPGTTRDTIEEQAELRGICVRFIDTAGIRESEDLVERMGIERSREALSRADLVLLMIDAGRELSAEDAQLMELCRGRSALLVLNKSDKKQLVGEDELKELWPGRIIRTSLTEGSGIAELEDAIEEFVTAGSFARTEDPLVSDSRHIDLLRRASEELTQACGEIEAGSALDFIELNVRSAFELLGEITGETASDEIINEVFSRFCLGK